MEQIGRYQIVPAGAQTGIYVIDTAVGDAWRFQPYERSLDESPGRWTYIGNPAEEGPVPTAGGADE